jgi:transposase
VSTPICSRCCPVIRLRCRVSIPGAVGTPLECFWRALDESIHRTLALGRLARVVELDGELRAAQRLIAKTLDVSGTGLREHRGIGVLIAARLIAEVRDIRRFPTADAFARVNGTAPIPASSGQTHHHRLNRGGNRRLNHALHMMALVHVRTDPRAKAYIAKHRAAGKSYREAVRALKRRLSDVVWRQLRDDLHGAAGPIAERE